MDQFSNKIYNFKVIQNNFKITGVAYTKQSFRRKMFGK